MTVRSLIERLKREDPNARVFFLPLAPDKSRWWMTTMSEVVDVGSANGGDGAESFAIVSLRGRVPGKST